MALRLPKALTAQEYKALRAVPKNPRDQALITVMAGCGLRVSEACQLTLENIHWSGETPSLRFTGKRDKERVVPMNLDVQDALRIWLEARGTGRSPYVFCTLRTGDRLSRKTVWGAFKRHARKAGIRHVHPHMLRHTFGTGLADRDVPVERIRELMGHEKIETSKVYISVSAEQKRWAVDRLDRRSWFTRWVSRQRNQAYRVRGRFRTAPVIPPGQTVGRRTERKQLQEHLDKGIDTLLVGPVGVGKSHLLKLLKGRQVIRLKGLMPVRQVVIEIAEALHKHGVCVGGKTEETSRTHSPAEVLGRPSAPAEGDSLTQATGEMPGEETPVDGDASGTTKDFEVIRKRHARTDVRGWTQMVLAAVEKKAWTLVVDDLSDLTVSGGRLVDQLNRKFVVIAALQEVKRAREKHFWRFDRVALGNLTPAEARQLIAQCVAGAQVEDPRMFETYVLQKSAGNPRAIVEIVDRLRREPAITRSAVRDVVHTGARSQIDLTPALIVLVVLLVAGRVIARGLGSSELYILTGAGAAAMMGIRFFLFRFRN